MSLTASFLIALVGLLHVYFLLLEMVFWTRPLGRRTFRMSLAEAKETATLAANQGLYNGFLAAGLAWALLHPDPAVGVQLAIFFLGCVLLAAFYGGWSVGSRILLIQGLPGALALAATLCT